MIVSDCLFDTRNFKFLFFNEKIASIHPIAKLLRGPQKSVTFVVSANHRFVLSFSCTHFSTRPILLTLSWRVKLPIWAEQMRFFTERVVPKKVSQLVRVLISKMNWRAKFTFTAHLNYSNSSFSFSFISFCSSMNNVKLNTRCIPFSFSGLSKKLASIKFLLYFFQFFV